MRWITVLLSILLFGCTDNSKIPPDIIQRPKMEKIMREMVQADRFVNSFITSRKDTLGRNKKETIDVYDKVFDYNGITRQEFIHSYKFYLGRPDILKVIFDTISVQAERKRAEANTLKADSLRKKPLHRP